MNGYNGFWKKKVLSLPAAIILSLVIAVFASGITYYANKPAGVPNGQSAAEVQSGQPAKESIEDLYSDAIADAMVAEADELMPLVAVTKDSNLIQWNENKDKVLVATWHKYPDSYVPGMEVSLDWGDVWVFSDKELHSWCEKGNLDCQDKILRLEQLIGLPPEKGYTHFTAMWVAPADLFRPGYDNEIDDTVAGLAFPEDADAGYVQWFHNNIIDSYFPESYPWTRLGYTYDWSGRGTEYGLSEFVVKTGSKVIVENTYTNEAFLAYLEAE